MDGATHRFGGNWTERKLRILKDYLTAYTTALKNQPFKKIYIDAFAGSGFIDLSTNPPPPSLFDEPVDSGPGSPAKESKGSASIALETDPPFDEWIFIEKDAKKCKELEKLRHQYPEYGPMIHIQQGEANKELQNLCKMDWSNRRAVIFLDPYGMQVDWTTVESIARTRAVDMWYLFPLGIGLNRMLPKSGRIQESWENRITRCLGTGEWYSKLYSVDYQENIFGERQEHLIKESIDGLQRWFLERLQQTFEAVSPNPAILKNSTNNPMYMLCFAAANPAGAQIALKIADHILNKI